MSGPRMLRGGAALGLLLAGYLVFQWFGRDSAPPMTASPSTEPQMAAANSPSAASPAPASAAVAPPPSASATAAVETSSAPAEPAGAMVHVVGAVRKPGVYRLPAKARLTDALRAAGGTRAGADLEAVNLASIVQDGEQIRVPLLAERRTLRTAAAPSARAAPRAITPLRPVRTTARYPLAVRPVAAPPPSEAASAPAVSSSGPVNINTASAEELDTLPGVGPSTADAIIQFRREHGPFQHVDDLREVRGIGEKKLAAMRDRIVLQ